MNHIITYSNGHEAVLTHYGILGQRKGKRRYQYEDGTYTPEGKARRRAEYEAQSPKDAKEEAENYRRKDKAVGRIVNETPNIANRAQRIYSLTKKQQPSKASKMSDKELREKVNRMQLERQYNQLSAEQVSKGRASVDNILSIAGEVLAAGASATAIVLAVRELRR